MKCLKCCSAIKLDELRIAIKFFMRLGLGKESNIGPLEEEALTIGP